MGLLEGVSCQPIMQKVRSDLDYCSGPSEFQILFQPFSSRFFSSFPSRYSSLSQIYAITNLEGGPPLFNQKSLYSGLLNELFDKKRKPRSFTDSLFIPKKQSFYQKVKLQFVSLTTTSNFSVD